MDYLKCIESFIAATETGSFSAAAERLGLTPAMVGRHILELEKRTHCQLIQRTTRRQGLTDAGSQYYLYALQILATIKQADMTSRHGDRPVSGTLRISAPVVYGQKKITPVLARFLKQYPGINAELILTNRRMDMISERIQVAIRIGQIQDEGVIAIPLPDYEMVMVASPAYVAEHGLPGSPAELTHHDCISFPQWRSDHFWQLECDGNTEQIELTPRLVVDSGEAMRQAALAGLGIALHSRLLLQNDIDEGRLCQVLPSNRPVARPIHLLRLPVHPAVPMIDLFCKYLINALKEQ